MLTKAIKLVTMLFAALPILAEADVTIASSPAAGIGPEAGVMRRDPIDVIRVGEKKGSLPFIELIPFDWQSVTPPHNAAP